MSKLSEANRAIVTAMLDASNAGQDILSYLADDATWWVPGHWQLGGTYRKHELAEVFSIAVSLMEGTPRLTIHAITAEDDRVAVDCEGLGRFRDGTLYHNTYHFLFRLRDGQIVSVKEFMNTAYMSQILADQLAKANG